MNKKRRPWWISPLIGLAVIVALYGLGVKVIGAYARDEVQWVFMNEMRSIYFPDYFVVHGRWPTDLSGVDEFFRTSDHPGRETLIWLNNQEKPSLEVIQSTNDHFIGKLNFHTFLSSKYDVESKALSQSEMEEQYQAIIDEKYLYGFHNDHEKWPVDLTEALKYCGPKGSLQCQAFAKMTAELKPKLVLEKVSKSEFHAKIEFQCTPSASLNVEAFMP